MKEQDHATTSALLKLLLRRLTFRRPGREPALLAGTTTAFAAFVVIHASEVVWPAGFPPLAADLATSFNEVGFPATTFDFRVGNLDGIGDAGGRLRDAAPGAMLESDSVLLCRLFNVETLPPAATFVTASRGILLGLGFEEDAVGFVGETGIVGAVLADAAERVMRVGRTSDFDLSALARTAPGRVDVAVFATFFSGTI